MMRTEITDEELVQRVLAGEDHAFAALVARYTNVLSSIAFPRVRNVEDVRDVVQEAFVIAYCDLDQLEAPGKFGAWIRGILVNRCCKVLDKRTSTQRFLERLPNTVEIPDPAGELVVKENVCQVLRALDTLDELRREIVVLYYFQDLKVDGIAQLVNRPAGTIKRILAEARDKLREELVDMAREEFREYYLTEEQRARLDMIPVFPRDEPKITSRRLDEPAQKIRIQAPHGNFPALQAGAEGFYADYNYPSRKLYMVTHVRVEGPIDIRGRHALRYDNLQFTPEGKAEWIWRPCYVVEGDIFQYWAKQFGECKAETPLVSPDHPDWGEPDFPPESLILVPGAVKEPNGELQGNIVDTNLWEVKIGRRVFKCVRRITGGDKTPVDWSDTPISYAAPEEFFLPDGRLILWRRYNGPGWGVKPGRTKDAPGTYEGLVEAGVPELELFGVKYYLYYDQIPDYAIR